MAVSAPVFLRLERMVVVGVGQPNRRYHTEKLKFPVLSAIVNHY